MPLFFLCGKSFSVSLTAEGAKVFAEERREKLKLEHYQGPPKRAFA